MQVLWLYSYPKTGSTWVRRVIQEIVAPNISAFDAISSVQYDIPEDPMLFNIFDENISVFKTHNPYNHPTITNKKINSVGYISIYRHPLDVLLSSLNYSFAKGEGRIFKNGILKNVDDIIRDDELAYYIGQFVRHQGCRRYVKWCGGYELYYRGWESITSKRRSLMLRYEEVVSNKAAAIERIADFLGQRGVDCLQINKKIEEKTAIDGQFHWRKKAYNFDGYVSKRLVSKFERSCANLLDYFGYEPTIKPKLLREAKPLDM